MTCSDSDKGTLSVDEQLMEARNILCRAMLAVELLADVCGTCERRNVGERMPVALRDLQLVADFLHKLDTGAFVFDAQNDIPTRRE
jgi:hypothetical protein